MAKKKKSYKMKSYDHFDHWLSDQKEPLQKLIKPIRSLMKKEFSKLEETVKWGNGCWVSAELPIVYIYADEDHIQLGFFAGSLLKDPSGLLEGRGQFIRFIRIKNRKDLNKDYFVRLCKQAVKIKYR